MANSSVREALSAGPVQKSDEDFRPNVQKLDGIGVDKPLAMAKCELGHAMRQAITRTDASPKEFGDHSYVNRICDGEVPTVLARIWSRADTRREFVQALAVASGFYEVETTLKPLKKVVR